MFHPTNPGSSSPLLRRPAERSITCTDIAPAAVAGATQFTCPQQAGFGKCGEQGVGASKCEF